MSNVTAVHFALFICIHDAKYTHLIICVLLVWDIICSDMATDKKQKNFVSLLEVERFALSVLPRNAVDFFSCGANDEHTLRDNVNAFQRWRIRPRMLRNVTDVDLSTSVLGHLIDIPICIAPTGYHGLAHPEAEVATAKGAAQMNTIYTISSNCNSRLEDIHNHVPNGKHFFQFYTYGIPNKRSVALQMIRHAAEQGFKASVLTVDLPVLGERYCNMRHSFKLPSHLRVPLLENLEGIGDHFHARHDTNLTWDDIKWLTENSPLPVILKGIHTAEDAELAVQCGVAAIIVSNHGGRQLDTVLATIDILPEVVAAVKGRCEVYVDGGIRHGTDVLKALALGARAVFIGRPVVYGLACGGSVGVEQVLTILKNELSTAMALAGCANIQDIKQEMVVHQSSHWAKL